MTKLTGSKQAPKAEGYYWFKGKPKYRDGMPFVVEVLFNGDELDYHLPGEESRYSPKHFKGLWYGPIKVPRQLKK